MTQQIQLIPPSMTAASLAHYHAEPSTALVVGSVPVPVAGRGELLVRVRAAGVNPIDCKLRRGYLRAAAGLPRHRVLGMDLAGEVVAVGADASAFALGDRVFASPSHRRMGGYAEYAVIAAAEAAPMPASLTFAEAAGVPLAGLTAWDALVRVGRLAPGQRVLVQAGAGGVGTLAIQLAKHLGAFVYATCSAGNAELVRSLGADRVIDYATEDYALVARGCDLVVDALGLADVARAVRTVRRGGRVVALASGMPDAAQRVGPYLAVALTGARLLGLVAWAKLRHGVTLRPITRRPSGENLAALGALIERGAIRPVMDRCFPLEEAAAAHAYLELGRARGKVVLLPAGTAVEG